MRRKTTEQFVQEAKVIHGDKYNYDLVEYQGNKIKVKIWCNKCHKLFYQTPDTHLHNHGCPFCVGQNKTTESFVEEAKQIHGNKYNYDQVEYINEDTPIKIWCNTCGKFFYQTPRHHLKKCGCQKCANKNRAIRQSLTVDGFINKSKNIHGNKYDYTYVDYKNSYTKVKILCKKCNIIFEQLPIHHMRGSGCPNCFYNERKKTQEEFIKESIGIYGDKYSYDFVNYINNRTKVKIFCNNCKKFFIHTPDYHLHKGGCPYCSPKSKGEETIRKILENNNINFVEQKKFQNCRDKNPLPFDFYLPDYNLCIEYQGEQHYKPNMFICLCKSKEKGIKNFSKQRLHDEIKKKFCKNNHINLLEIKYNDNINEVLNKAIINKEVQNES